MAVAFFDLDHTIFATNSVALWLRREVASGHVSRWQAFQAALWLAGYAVGIASLDGAVRKAILTLAGMSAEPVRHRSEAFFREYLRHAYRPGALAAMADHRRNGDRLVLLTASSSYIAEHVATDLGFDACLCNELEVDDAGRHTGRTVGELCFGTGKLAHARAYAAEVGVPLEACAFYTDAFSDLPMLLKVGTPVAVNPDPRLRREALRRRWKIVDWGLPATRPQLPPPPADRTAAPPVLH